MKRKILMVSLFALLLTLPAIALPILAKSPNQIMLSNPDYVLNILGKDHFTNNPMQDSPDRHTIFIPLQGGSQIYITQAPRGSGEKFQVLDANAFDDGHANLTLGDGYYAVWITALGKPNGKLDLNATVSNQDIMIQLQCIKVERAKKGGPNWMDESKLFYITYSQIYDFFLQYYTMMAAVDPTITDPVLNATQALNDAWAVFESTDVVWDIGEIYGLEEPAVWIFDFFDYLSEIFDYPGSEYYWNLKNNGLRHLQVRFYKLPKSRNFQWVFPET
jgi:hypothetical protein